MNNKKKLENTLTAVGITAILSGAAYGLYCYLKDNSHEVYQSQSPEKTKQRRSEKFSEELCPICYELLTNNKSITFGCKHSFHKKCIGQWKSISNSCPVCRADFT